MGSKQHSSLTNSVEDTAYQLAAFEEMNSCTLSVCFEAIWKSGKCSLLMKVDAFTWTTVPADRALLASVSVEVSQLLYKRLEDVITFGLYKIDAALAHREMGIDQLI